MSENFADTPKNGNAIWVNSKKSVLRLKVNQNDEFLLNFAQDDILGASGFEITKYGEAA